MNAGYYISILLCWLGIICAVWALWFDGKYPTSSYKMNPLSEFVFSLALSWLIPGGLIIGLITMLLGLV